MAIANENALGTIVLAGDLAGGMDPTGPQLTPTGVTPGEYKGATVVVDAKGRILHARKLSELDVPCADVGVCGIVKIGNNITATTVEDGSTSVSIIKATETDYGVVKLGPGFTKGCCEMYVDYPKATTTTAGSVIVPASGNLVIDANANISVPIGSKTVKGLVYANSGGLTIGGGVLSFNPAGATYPTATTTSTGMVSVPTANNLSINGSGVVTFDSLNATFANATTSAKGMVQVGSNVSVSSGTISLAVGSATVAGTIRGDADITHSSGTISYTKVATAGSLGLVKVGAGLGVDVDGSLSRGAGSGDATTTSKGVVQINGDGTIFVSGGLISVNDATASTKGLFRGNPALFSHTGGQISITKLASTVQAGPVGVMKVGGNLAVTADGTLSRSNIPGDASTIVKGKVRGDNTTVTVSSGVLSIPLATTSTKGVVQIGNGFSMSGVVMSMPTATASTQGAAKALVNNTVGNRDAFINNGSISFTVHSSRHETVRCTAPASIPDYTNEFYFTNYSSAVNSYSNWNGSNKLLNTTLNRHSIQPSGAFEFGTPVGMVPGSKHNIAVQGNYDFSFATGWKVPVGLLDGSRHFVWPVGASSTTNAVISAIAISATEMLVIDIIAVV